MLRPFKCHKKKRKPDGTHNLALETVEQLKSKNIHVIPGCKVCRNCHQQIKDFLDDDTDDVFMDDVDECTTNVFESTVHIAEQRDELNESLGIIGISPLKTHAVSKFSKVKEACEKINRSHENQKEMAKEPFALPDTSQLEMKDDVIDKDMESKVKNQRKINDNGSKDSTAHHGPA